MDIHRCRFVPYRPQSINTFAFSHRSNPKQRSPRDLRLALGRENGDIEIWNPYDGKWVQEKILRGSANRTIEQLAWTQDVLVDEDDTDHQIREGPLRLFSSGGSPSITEWDLTTGLQRRQAEGNLGDIWCFAAQPQWETNTKALDVNKIAGSPCQLLAAGCADGAVILFTTADDSLQFSRILLPASGKKSKVISITWRDRHTVIAGYENGTIRVIDVPSRTTTRIMTLGKTRDNSPCVVWSLNCLADGTILSGDSSGELKIWDNRTLSLLQRLKAHDADILGITSSANGNTVFTTGVDRKLVAFKQVPVQDNNKKGRWQELSHRRFHQHDVKALASFESKGMSILVSGGMDTVPIVMPLRNWESENHRSLSYLPQIPQMSCSSKAHLMLTWWDREILIWRLPIPSVPGLVQLNTSDQNNHELLAKIELRGDENITSAQMSEDGRMVVAATAAGVRLFQLRQRMGSGILEVRTRPIDLPASIRSFGASSVGFSPDNKWLFAVRTSNLMVLIKIVGGSSSKDKPQLYHQVVKLSRRHRKNVGSDSSKLGGYTKSVHCVSFSSDSRVIAVGDLSGVIDVWVLEGHEDLLNRLDDRQDLASDGSEEESDSDSDDESDSRVIHGQKWVRNSSGSTMPQLDSAILALSFKPRSSSSHSSDSPLGLHATRHNPNPVSHELPPMDTKLIAVTVSHRIIEFDVMTSKLSDWSRRNPSMYLPQSFTQIKDRVMGTFWDYSPILRRERLWLYGPNWLFMLDMTRGLNPAYAHDKVGQIGGHDVHEPVVDSATPRKAGGEAVALAFPRKRKRNTGAGDRKKPQGDTFLDPRRQRNADAMDIDTGLLSPASEDEHDEEDTDIDDTGALTQLRRETALAKSQSDDSEQSISTDQSPAHHTMFRYRSIFGISALHPPNPNADTDTEADLSTNANLEIVLVERPLYDIDLLPRFDGRQDWAT